MTQARLELDPYTARVLDVVKGKFSLKNRNEALKRFVEEHGPAYVEMNVDERILHELDRIHDEHTRQHPRRTMSEKDLNELLGL